MTIKFGQTELPYGLRGGSDTWDQPQASVILDDDFFTGPLGYAKVLLPITDSINTLTVSTIKVLDNPNAFGTSANDLFGRAVAIDGNLVVVGAYNEDDAGGIDSGKAYIFNATTGALLQTLSNPNAFGTSANDFFGLPVAISGNLVVVGAYLEDDAGGLGSGKAYIFDATTGAVLQTLSNPNAFGTSDSDSFGGRVAISGNLVVISTPNEDDAGGLGSGKAYIFNATTGALLQTLSNPNAFGTSAADSFGISVAIDGNLVVVGACNEDDAGGLNSGKAYIFNATTGAVLQTLSNPNAFGTSDSDSFGISVAISGNLVVVGADLEDDAGGLNSGKAYIFDATTGVLLQTLSNPNPDGISTNDSFGSVLDISGNLVVVSASRDDAGGIDSGKAYIFNATTGALLQTLSNPNAFGTSANDRFGLSMGISGRTLIVGVAESDADAFDSGKSYLFSLDNWQYKPVRVWNGVGWFKKPLKYWNGTAWIVK